MKELQRMSGRMLVLAGLAMLLGCVDYPARPVVYGPGGLYAYDYYPDAEVYYAPDRHLYYWRDHDQWRWGRQAPAGIELGSHVGVKLGSAEPFRQHEEMRTRYPRQHAEEHERR